MHKNDYVWVGKYEMKVERFRDKNKNSKRILSSQTEKKQ